MEFLLHRRHKLTIWERHPKAGTAPVDLESAAEGQDFILFCLPAIPHFDLASRLRPHLPRECLCLNFAKGLDERGRTAAQAMSAALGRNSAFGVLYGPMISEEIRAGRPAFAQAGAANAESYGRIRALYAGTPLYLEHSADITGISWAAVLKNVYAMLFGVADELNLGDNMRGYLAASVLEELEQIVASLGGTPEAVRRLVRGQAEVIEGEGVHTLKMIRDHGLFDSRRYPLFDLIGSLLAKPTAAGPQMKNYLEQLLQ
jgi:glycerol-3-phosphate dehydrogenase (NAD(P)+)